MDLFILLGIFPIVTNLIRLFSPKVNYLMKINEKTKAQRSFIYCALISIFVWIIWGFFTEQWKIMLFFLLINGTLMKGLFLRFKSTSYEPVVQFLSTWFNLIMICYILLDRSDNLYLVFNFFKDIF